MVNILILGATGRIGSRLLKHALGDGHNVSVLVRDTNKLSFADTNLTVFKGNALDSIAIQDAMRGIDVVFSALSTDGKNTLSLGMQHIVNAMKSQEVKRIISVGTAGILQSRINPDLLRYQNNESRQKTSFAAREHHIVYLLLKDSGLEWTMVCPTYLVKENYTGGFRVEKNLLPLNGKKISFKDAANFTYFQINSLEYLRTRVGISY